MRSHSKRADLIIRFHSCVCRPWVGAGVPLCPTAAACLPWWWRPRCHTLTAIAVYCCTSANTRRIGWPFRHIVAAVCSVELFHAHNTNMRALTRITLSLALSLSHSLAWSSSSSSSRPIIIHAPDSSPSSFSVEVGVKREGGGGWCCQRKCWLTINVFDAALRGDNIVGRVFLVGFFAAHEWLGFRLFVVYFIEIFLRHFRYLFAKFAKELITYIVRIKRPQLRRNFIGNTPILLINPSQL